MVKDFHNVTLFQESVFNMFRYGISLEVRTKLEMLNRGISAGRYIRDILEPHVAPFTPFICNDFMLMQYNVPPHEARIFNCLRE